jgi:hypothetical protein
MQPAGGTRTWEQLTPIERTAMWDTNPARAKKLIEESNERIEGREGRTA